MMINGFIALDNGKPIIESVRADEDGVREEIGNRFALDYGGGWVIAEQLGYTMKPCVVMIDN
jgi:hypothetical protein